MKTIAIAVQKGGTGKTTTTYNVAAELAAKGKRTLLIDVDPQANLTADFGPYEATRTNNIAGVFGDNKPGKLKLTDILLSASNMVDYAPGSIDLAVTELLISGRLGRENILKRALESVSGSYDFCLIDTPPSLGLLTINALAAANGVLVPILPAAHDIRSLQLFLQTLQDMKDINPNLHLLGVILNRYDKRLQLHRQAAEEITAAGLPLIQPYITQSVRISEATGQYKSLRDYDPNNPNNAAYAAIADLIIQEN